VRCPRAGPVRFAGPWTGDVAAPTWNPRLHYFIYPGRQLLSCDMAGSNWVCGQVYTQGITAVWLRIGERTEAPNKKRIVWPQRVLFLSRRLMRCAEYDSIAGVYTMLYRYSQFSPWVIQGQVVEQSIITNWGKIISPRVGLMLKNWVTNQQTLADFTQFTCGSLGLWARAATSYFPPANVLTLPLPRRVLYDVSVYAISATGVWSPAAVAQVTPLVPIVVGPQPASALPGVNALAAGAVSYLDPSGSNQQVPSVRLVLHSDALIAFDAPSDLLYNCCRRI
jgi:hypothetical protein